MPIPDFQTLMLPVLRMLADKKIRSTSAIRQAIAAEFKLTELERTEMLPSGTVARFDNNVSWAITFLMKAQLLTRPGRGQYTISPRGIAVLGENPTRVDMRYLARFPEYVAWREASGSGRESHRSTPASEPPAPHTPEEQFGEAYQEIRAALADDVLDRVKSCSPRFFERLVVRLLVRMGYGGSEQEAVARVVGKSRDGGIDGIIQEDKLGLDSIYVQAKRWDNAIAPSMVRDFSGSLDTHGAKKGVFITTSHFTADARNFVETARTDKKIVLIDGSRLAELMIDYDVGVSIDRVYTIKRLDSDYFDEE
jgi:restriction system protein